MQLESCGRNFQESESQPPLSDVDQMYIWTVFTTTTGGQSNAL